jgi:hypothetical protein
LVSEQVLQFLRLKPCENAFLSGSCSKTEVSQQLYCLSSMPLSGVEQDWTFFLKTVMLKKGDNYGSNVL